LIDDREIFENTVIPRDAEKEEIAKCRRDEVNKCKKALIGSSIVEETKTSRIPDRIGKLEQLKNILLEYKDTCDILELDEPWKNYARAHVVRF